MSLTYLAFVLTTLAGLSTLIGTFIIFIKTKNKNKIIAASLSFASAVMLSISICDLTVESINLLNTNFNGIVVCILTFLFIIIGIILSMVIDYFLPTNISTANNNLYKVGIIAMLAIIFHNIPEGIATFMATNTDASLGLSLTIAIAMHNIPEGIAISIPIYYATKSKLLAFKYTFISALSEPFGALITYLFLQEYITTNIMGYLFAIIAGIMIQISFCELLKTARTYENDKYVKVFFLIGLLFSITYITIF